MDCREGAEVPQHLASQLLSEAERQLLRRASVELHKVGQVTGQIFPLEVRAALNFNRKFVGHIARPTFAWC
jgi:hypothetical protein